MKSLALRASARGEECTFNIAKVCNYNPETSVLCHLPDESNGMGTKSDDFCSAVGCSSCHAVVDGHIYDPGYMESKDFYNRRAMVRTWRRWIEQGLVTIKGLK